ncbi:MAG: patatin-like phospholipase family protein [Candidatus Obscuribacterales bacterium]|jgi:predicted acylesterase/phospholipase RssA|nr:patatin-like phospholipase family protein [Candidatus Obscuribacterales bacterium]
MSSFTLNPVDKLFRDKSDFELAISSGGATSALAGAGTLLACELAGIRSFRRIGGVSGGSLVTVLRSLGVPNVELVKMALTTEFSDHLCLKHGIAGALKALRNFGRVETECHEGGDTYTTWQMTGLYGSDGLGALIEAKAMEVGRDPNDWPASFWTMATTKDGSQVYFCKDGVFLIRLNGDVTQLTDKPPPVALAVRFSCTIPGVLAALEYKGMLLFDGALSRDGLCPVGMLIRHFGADPYKIIACRVGEDSLKPVSGRLHRFARRVWRVHPMFHWGPETAGVIEFRPQIEHVHSLKFKLSTDEKWLAILVSFEACLGQLALEGLLSDEALAKSQEIFKGFGFWRDAQPAPIGAPQVLSRRVERCLTEHGLYY